MARQVLENGVILPAEYSDDWYDDMTSNLTKLDDVIGSDSEKLSSADVGAAALSNNYNDLDNLPTIPTVNDATLTIQKNGVDVQTFTANASSNVTANITVPTKTSDLTNDSNFVDTSNSAVASGITSAKVTSYDSHIADTDIHVTTADKTKWNNGISQSYVLRYSSSSVTDNSTIAYSTLDNTDNIKASDKVIDVNGKIFSVVSVDTTNQTVTVGSALIDLALDANVVHTSGNENVGGIKNFTDDTYIKSLNFTNEVASPSSSSSSSIMPLVTTVTYTDQTASKSAQINLRITASGDKSLYPHENNQYALGLTSRKWSEIHGVTYYYGSSDTEFSNKFVTTDTDQTITGAKTWANAQVWSVNCQRRITSTFEKGDVPSTSQAIKDYYTVKNGTTSYENALGVFGCSITTGNKVSTYFHALKNQAGVSTRATFEVSYDTNTDQKEITTNADFLPTSSGQGIGNSTSKWKSINGLEPSSLSLPNLTNAVDISGYITDFTGSPNIYSPPANGYIVLRSTTANVLGIVENTTGMGSYSRGSNQVLAVYMPVVKNSSISIYAICSSLTHAKFIPCQGNV